MKNLGSCCSHASNVVPTCLLWQYKTVFFFINEQDNDSFQWFVCWNHNHFRVSLPNTRSSNENIGILLQKTPRVYLRRGFMLHNGLS